MIRNLVQRAADAVACEDCKPRWARRKEARPQELVAAALHLFVEKGYAATRLDDVAAAAGVSKGTVYLYFSNKEDLFKAVIRENVLPALAVGLEMVQKHEGDSASLFKALMLAWWERIGQTEASGLVKLMMAEAQNFPDIAQFYHDEVILPGNKLLETVLKRGIASGEFQVGNLEQATHVLIAPMLLLMMWRHSFGPCAKNSDDPVAYLEQYVDIALHGLCVKTR